MQQNIISNFFRPINTDIQIPDSEYAKTDVCIVMADAWPAIPIIAYIS